MFAPKRVCASPGCPNRVDRGHCATHRRQKDIARGSSRQRGYSHRWSVYSKRRLAEFPLCAGFPEGYHGSFPKLAEVTDHIVSARERPDLFFEPTNHQSLCVECNSRKAIALEGGFGR